MYRIQNKYFITNKCLNRSLSSREKTTMNKLRLLLEFKKNLEPHIQALFSNRRKTALKRKSLSSRAAHIRSLVFSKAALVSSFLMFKVCSPHLRGDVEFCWPLGQREDL